MTKSIYDLNIFKSDEIVNEVISRYAKRCEYRRFADSDVNVMRKVIRKIGKIWVGCAGNPNRVKVIDLVRDLEDKAKKINDYLDHLKRFDKDLEKLSPSDEERAVSIFDWMRNMYSSDSYGRQIITVSDYARAIEDQEDSYLYNEVYLDFEKEELEKELGEEMDEDGYYPEEKEHKMKDMLQDKYLTGDYTGVYTTICFTNVEEATEVAEILNLPEGYKITRCSQYGFKEVGDFINAAIDKEVV